jgi:hypothetical protein
VVAAGVAAAEGAEEVEEVEVAGEAAEAAEAGEEEAEVAGEAEVAEEAVAPQAEAEEAWGGVTQSTGSSSASSSRWVGSPPTCARVRSAPGRHWRPMRCRHGRSLRAGARASTGAA